MSLISPLMSTYARLPVRFVRGEGVWLWDTEGRKYLDVLSGIGVCGLGHAHPAVAKAICEQADILLHTSNLYGIPHQILLANVLARLLNLSNSSEAKDRQAHLYHSFFCNSGAEANEAGIKIARMYGYQKDVDLPEIIVAEGSFHGRTLATLTATGNLKIQRGFGPLVPGFLRVPFNDPAAIAAMIGNNPNVVAVLLEPIQGEGGVIVPDEGYLKAVRTLCDQYDLLMMLDEVQTGMGRTGQWFAWQHSGAAPDVIMLAKALGNGIPIGACLARGRAGDLLTPGSHGSTFGGNPLACCAALTVVDVMEKEGLPERASRVGEKFRLALIDALHGMKVISQIRGKGLMIGVEFNRPCGELVQKALVRGLLVNVTAGNVLRLLPPLIIQDREIDQTVQTVSELVHEFSRGK
uniref:Acetylornithine aminotransferase n=1 Tax=Candidatus Kentrum sp. MB TaxID=2138164 RepID=A0A450XSG1_9GAMM|nr:MAG: acetylornithine aminotransferase apoenzyme [Candidatus Kentron sp. MB]VFK32224.1 MAG: acetylornithine aminotransferase apoenzyme [Candidatus Kentron sp. MB]VFK75758.1 MAG: acetylornithine aminotransferase apoenzyme [Candidatus Kentron sp. MB]